MCLSCLSDLPLLRLYFFALADFSPFRRTDRVRLDHIGGLFDNVELLVHVWRQLVALAINLESPMFDLPKNMHFILGVDVFGKGLHMLALLLDEIVTFIDGERRGHPVNILERRHLTQSNT